MARQRSINYDLVVQDYRRGRTIAELARKYGCSESGVRYAVRPQLRRNSEAAGRRRTVYVPDEAWERFADLARRTRKPRSTLLLEMLEERIAAEDAAEAAGL